MSGIEVAVGFLIAWAVRKSRHVGERVDVLTDEALDVMLDRLHSIVLDKLGADPALAALEQQASTDGEVRSTTRDRVRLAMHEAAEDDSVFAAELAHAIDHLQTISTNPPGATAAAFHGSVNQGSRSNVFGPVTGSRIEIHQSSNQRAEACFCGRHADAVCPKCSKGACSEHFYTDARAYQYRELNTSWAKNEPGNFRTHESYASLFATGGPRCVRCRFEDADRMVQDAQAFAASWMRAQRPLTIEEFRYLSNFPSMLPLDTVRKVLAHAYLLYEPDAEIAWVSVSGTRPAETRRTRGKPLLRPWTTAVTTHRTEAAVTVQKTQLFLASGGLVYRMHYGGEIYQKGPTLVIVSDGNLPPVRMYSHDEGTVLDLSKWRFEEHSVVQAVPIEAFTTFQPFTLSISALLQEITNCPQRSASR